MESNLDQDNPSRDILTTNVVLSYELIRGHVIYLIHTGYAAVESLQAPGKFSFFNLTCTADWTGRIDFTCDPVDAAFHQNGTGAYSNQFNPLANPSIFDLAKIIQPELAIRIVAIDWLQAANSELRSLGREKTRVKMFPNGESILYRNLGGRNEASRPMLQSRPYRGSENVAVIECV